MSKQDRSAVRAGLFIVITFVVAVAVVIGISGVGALFSPSRDVNVAFELSDDIGGLRAGDDVRLGGFKVGSIKDIAVMDAPSGGQPRIFMRISVPQKYTLRQDAVVRIQSTLTGSSVLNIESLGQGKVLAAGDTLTGRPGALSTIFASAGQLVPEAQQLLTEIRQQTVPRVNTALDTATGTLETFRKTGEEATAAVALVRGKADPLIARADDMLLQIRDFFGESKTDFRGTVANLNKTTASLSEKIPGILEKTDQTVASARDALEDVKATVANTRELTASANEIIGGNRGKIDEMLDGLKKTSDNLENATAELWRNPWRLLYRPGAGEVNNLTLFDAARQFAEGANDLNDAALALRDASRNPNLSQEQMQKLVEKLELSFTRFRDVEGKLWKEAK